MSNSKILIKICGSIACFKVASIVSDLTKEGHDVKVVGTPNVTNFIGTSTWEGLSKQKYLDNTFSSGEVHSHIHLDQWADIICLAPATANTLNKMAAGIGDNLVTNLFLAHDFSKPYIVVPAMNTKMLEHPATQDSFKKLKAWGLTFVSPNHGKLACGDTGPGRMAEPDQVLTEIRRQLNLSKNINKPLSVLITSGGTEEPIDDIRSITNTSTGYTGSKLADYYYSLGHKVTYLHANKALKPASPVEMHSFSNFSSLQKLLQKELSQKYFDMVYHAAAVSDYSLTDPIQGKLPSTNTTQTLDLKKNLKLVNVIKSFSKNPNIKLIAFKLTSTNKTDEQCKAIEKLFSNSPADLVIHNDYLDIKKGNHQFYLYKKHRPEFSEKFNSPEEFASNINLDTKGAT